MYLHGYTQNRKLTIIMYYLFVLYNNSARFDGKVGPREFLHPGCPKLTTKLQ